MLYGDTMTCLEAMKNAGVKLAFGTDLLAEQHTRQGTEFTMRSEVFSPVEILRQATSTAAEVVRMEGEIGCIREGAYADVLVVDGDPTRDIALPASDGADLSVVMRDSPIPDWVVEALGGPGPEPASDRFLAFLEEELDPLIRERYEHDPTATCFCGDSYGGLFGLYALFRQSPVFSHYLLGSPGAVLDDDPVFAVEAAQFGAGVALEGRAYFSIGEHEQADSGTAYETLGKNYLRFAALLRERAYPNLAWTAEIIPGETHASVVPFALSRGMRWLFDPDGLPLAPVPTLD